MRRYSTSASGDGRVAHALWRSSPARSRRWSPARRRLPRGVGRVRRAGGQALARFLIFGEGWEESELAGWSPLPLRGSLGVGVRCHDESEPGRGVGYGPRWIARAAAVGADLSPRETLGGQRLARSPRQLDVLEQSVDAVREGVAGEDDLAAGGAARGGLLRMREEMLDERVQFVGALVGHHGAAEALLEAVQAVADHQRAAGHGVVEPVGGIAVLAHVVPVVVEDDSRRRVRAPDLVVGQVLADDVLAADQRLPVAAPDREIAVRGQQVADDPAHDAA